MPNLVAFRRVDEKLTCGEEGSGSGDNFYRPSLLSTHTHTYTNIAPVEKATKNMAKVGCIIIQLTSGNSNLQGSSEISST